MKTLKLLSWNVNGLRAVMKKGFVDFLTKYRPDILGLQEIKITDATREKEEFDFGDYREYWNPAERPGYAGTAVLTKVEPLRVDCGFGRGEDKEGRIQTLEFEQFYFLNGYFPNANHELSRLPYKEEFNHDFLQYVKKLEQSKPVVVCGDFNVAREEIDLARPKANIGNPGFTDEERGWAKKFVRHGLVDTFRALQPAAVEYSWWSYRSLARARNIGWRIDYFFVSRSLFPQVEEAFILPATMGSDHCPVGLTLKL